ncbi:L-lactate dehydrogenase [Desulfitobacterium sp.]|uniref:L-lactate dehydrogenase n=1 Tax=Desulfitobacterium sp. TaxID=49981 RepID=UPI002C61DBEE|nr:L-lactate dehydrogenase [Desulfitobacterium sp.]HVJ49526.1 L-lactate dehydrogenase [Desulfitobacterium sp.]
MSIHSSKVVIIGSGFVGASIAYAALIRGLCNNLVLIDIDREKAEGEAMDLSHGLPFIRPVEIRAGGFEACEGAEIIIITAGANQKPGETRLDLVQKNAKIMQSILDEVVKYERNAILIIVSNPVDVLTAFARKVTDLPPEHIIGSGTVLDTARFRYTLSQRCGINASNIHAYVVGEHGDSEVLLFSSASIAGSSLDSFRENCAGVSEKDWREQVAAEVRRAAYEIISRKGATYYGIGLSCAQIMQAILRDEQKVLTVSSLLDDQYHDLGVALSVPSILGKNGIVRRLDLRMDTLEDELFQKSVQILRESLQRPMGNP